MEKQLISSKQMALVGIMAAILCVAGPLSIPIPISPVPITLTNFIIAMAAIILGGKLACMSTIIYLLLGSIGLPVFSGFGGGIGKLAGPTGGYLIGFIFMALIEGLVAEKNQNKIILFLAFLIATAVIYLFGTAWLALQMHLTFGQALWAGVIPYIPGDLVKIILAIMIAPPIRKRIYLSGAMNE